MVYIYQLPVEYCKQMSLYISIYIGTYYRCLMNASQTRTRQTRANPGSRDSLISVLWAKAHIKSLSYLGTTLSDIFSRCQGSWNVISWSYGYLPSTVWEDGENWALCKSVCGFRVDWRDVQSYVTGLGAINWMPKSSTRVPREEGGWLFQVRGIIEIDILLYTR